MRLFIAIDFNSEQLNMARDGLDISGIKTANSFHLTLKFLGLVDDNKVEDVNERLRKITFSSFRCRLTSFGGFPNLNSPKIIWVGLSNEKKFINIKKEIENKLGEFEEDINFTPHITLARIKSACDKDYLRIKIGELRKIKFYQEFFVEEFILYKSELKRDGPIYTAVEKFKLN